MGDFRTVSLVPDEDEAIGEIGFRFREKLDRGSDEIRVFHTEAIDIKECGDGACDFLAAVLVKPSEHPRVFSHDDHADPCRGGLGEFLPDKLLSLPELRGIVTGGEADEDIRIKRVTHWLRPRWRR